MDQLIEESRRLAHHHKPNLVILRLQELVREAAAHPERESDEASGPDAE